jgi:hypothetical protein
VATDTGYSRGDYLRVCDICGHRFHIKDLRPIGELRYACKDDSPGLTAMQISRWNARARPLKVRPNKWAKGITQTPTYQIPEANILNLITTVAPSQVQDGPSTALAAAWAAIYCADLLNQGLRPAGWLSTARAVLARCLTYLLTQQYGSATGISPAGSATNPRYGGILVSGVYDTTTTIAAGLAFTKAYQATGNPAYVQAADHCATFMRHVQSGDLQVSAWTVFPSGGGPYHIGGLASGVTDATGLLTTNYLLRDVAGLWFLSAFAAIQGSGTVYGDAAATAFFSASTAATLATMMAELGAFAATGARDSTATPVGAFVTGLSTTAPRGTYVAATNGGAGTGAWTVISTIDSDSVALATLGVFMASELNAQVTSVTAWLASFGANSANATPAQPESKTIAGITGTYDPTLCPADNLTTSAPFTEATGALYSWASLGLLAPILSQLTPGLRVPKDALSAPVRTDVIHYNWKQLGPLGLSGLSLQPGTRAADVVLAAKAGMAYRQPPGYYPQVALF